MAIVDDDDYVRLCFQEILREIGVEAFTFGKGGEILDHIARHRPLDLVLLDLRLPDMSGEDVLKEIHERSSSTAVVMVTAYGSIEIAVSLMRQGAAHFVTKPPDHDELLESVRRLGRKILSDRRPPEGIGFSGIVTQDPGMRAMLDLAANVARTQVTILLEGPSGVGKEVLARSIHEWSAVASGPMVAVNPAALPPELVESELFGHVKGAFTGATSDRAGVLVEASGGTLFLDEAASIPLSLQAKLLRVLQEKRVRPVGADRDVELDFRLIAATNRDLAALVREGTFREDLYHRLRVVSIRIPPLRERPGDIVHMAEHFLAEAARAYLQYNDAAPELSPEAIVELQRHDWPGNVRELENAIHRAVVVCRGRRILPHHLNLTPAPWDEQSAPAGKQSYADAKRCAIETFQRAFIQRKLEQADGNITHAAKACGMTRYALQKILRSLDLDREAFTSPDSPDSGEGEG